MDTLSVVKTLHPLEIKVILKYAESDVLDSAKLVRDLGYVAGQANQAQAWLMAKGLARELGRETRTVYEITELGRSWYDKGTPDELILNFLAKQQSVSLPVLCEATGLDQKDVGSAFGRLSKEGLVAMNTDKLITLQGSPKSARVEALRALLSKAISSSNSELSLSDLNPSEKDLIAQISKKRGAGDKASGIAFRIYDREILSWCLTKEAMTISDYLKEQGVSGDEVGAITAEMLESGSWKTASFRAYNIQSRPARIIPGRKNSYVQFLESVKDKLVSIGFEEFDGALVETEFWNGDALFMPQFHSARDIHDVYYVANPTMAKYIEEPFLSKVADAHEHGGVAGSRGWRYNFDKDFTRRLVLRSQGTVLSARKLPTASIPGKYFGMARCFRYDKVDATHLSDFYQTEGIVLGEDVNLKTLLGFLEMFATEIAGASEVKYVPGYFPFTEPSVEVHIKHPVLGWFELGGAGIFRPEVTEPLGVSVPVLAWGMGIDRMALMALGLSDLRDLFTYDIESARIKKITL